MKRMHFRDHESCIEECIYRPPKRQSIPVNAANGCHTCLKSEIKVENHEPHLFEEKPTPCVDTLLNSKMSHNESHFSTPESVDPQASEEKFTALVVDNPVNLHMGINAAEETWDPHLVVGEPKDKPVNSEMSLTASQIIFEDTVASFNFSSRVPVCCPLNQSPKEQKDPLSISPVKGRPHASDHLTNQLLTRAAEALRIRLKPNWICFLEGRGIHTMLLSRNFEKSVQRRIFFSSCGEVHLSVHCVPIPISNFVSCLNMVKLCHQHDISAFVDAMERIVNFVWELEICTGVSHDKYRPLWESSTRGEIDRNPYQEARYSVTLRSLQCSRLIRPRKRMCHSCCRLLDTLRSKARSRAKKLKSNSIL